MAVLNYFTTDVRFSRGALNTKQNSIVEKVPNRRQHYLWVVRPSKFTVPHARTGYANNPGAGASDSNKAATTMQVYFDCLGFWSTRG